MPETLEHPDAELEVIPLEDGRRRLHLTPKRNLFVPFQRWNTRYPMELLSLIFERTGVWAIDEVMREENPRYVAHAMKWEILSYVRDGAFENARVLDFGSGSGASAMVLARISTTATVIGVELDPNFVEIARARATFYNVADRVQFIRSNDANALPEEIGSFDYVILSAVFEHLLPEERLNVMPLLWKSLKVGGVMFIHQTPHRWFPIEHHTTGLPLINYLPDNIARLCAIRLSKRVAPTDDWATLLRKGIRGATHATVLDCINANGRAESLKPIRFGAKDHFDLWYEFSNYLQPTIVRKYAKLGFRVLHAAFGVTFVPYITMAVRKTG
jgi:tRNA(1-methyladenosine) methyltransferase and related methyltransferases